jgi:hypothetical protein
MILVTQIQVLHEKKLPHSPEILDFGTSFGLMNTVYLTVTEFNKI